MATQQPPGNPRISTKAKAGIAGAVIALVTGSLSFNAALDREEDNKAVPYKDIAGIWTVCRGYTGPKKINLQHVYTTEECNELNLPAAASVQGSILQFVNVPISQTEYEAYSGLAYNIGTGAFKSSTLLRKLNASDYTGACKEILNWDKARVNGVLRPVKGLTSRRKREYELCMTPVTLPSSLQTATIPIEVVATPEGEIKDVRTIQSVQVVPTSSGFFGRIRSFFLAGLETKGRRGFA